MSDIGRYIPLSVRTTLRQEAHFGCCVCGNPILDFHHIIPWNELQHNDPDHMIAVCPTHHREIAKRSRKYAYDLKQTPYNSVSGKLFGELATDKPKPSFLMGSNIFIDTTKIFTFYEEPIFQYRIQGDQSLISAYVPQSNFWPEIEIIDNDLVAQTGDFWDIEFATNYVKFRKRKGQTFFEIDLRGEHAQVCGIFNIAGNTFEFSPNSTNFSGTSFANCTIKNCGAGFGFGDGNHRLLRPNYAMLTPRPLLHRLR